MQCTYYPDWDEAAIDDDNGNYLAIVVPEKDIPIADCIVTQLKKLGLRTLSRWYKTKNRHGDIGHVATIMPIAANLWQQRVFPPENTQPSTSGTITTPPWPDTNTGR